MLSLLASPFTVDTLSTASKAPNPPVIHSIGVHSFRNVDSTYTQPTIGFFFSGNIL